MIYCIGEILYDIVFKNNQPVAGNAGGSMLNTAVSLGRLGAPVRFVGETGTDQLGQDVKAFLGSNGVDAQFVMQYPGRNTGIALAFLDDQQNATYSFYKDYPAERLTGVEVPFVAGDFVLFGSSFAFNLAVRPWLLLQLHKAREAGATIVYDPNYRTQKHLTADEQRSMFIENCNLAHIIRASQEDFDAIWSRQLPHEAWTLLQRVAHCQALIYTRNSQGVDVFTNVQSVHVAAHEIEPVSTIGAGDTFNAALLWQLNGKGLNAKNIEFSDQQTLEAILTIAVAAATDVCLQWGNYVSEEFVKTCQNGE